MNILMVWKKLWRCDLENWWCDQNSDGVKQIYKRVNNILMVWTKLWRCDLENRWCEQKNWWCEHNPKGVNKMYTVWSNNLTVWLKFLTVRSKSLRCEIIIYGVIKDLKVWSQIWRCDQNLDGVIKTLLVWSNVHLLEIVWSHRVVWSFHMFFSDESSCRVWFQFIELSGVCGILYATASQ